MVPSLVSVPEGGGSWPGAISDPTRHLIVVNTRSLGTAGAAAVDVFRTTSSFGK
jgi:hypothetical protein